MASGISKAENDFIKILVVENGLDKIPTSHSGFNLSYCAAE